MAMDKDLEMPTFGKIYDQLNFDNCYTAGTTEAEDEFVKEWEKIKSLLSHLSDNSIAEIENNLFMAQGFISMEFGKMGFEIGFKFAVEMLTKSQVKIF